MGLAWGKGKGGRVAHWGSVFSVGGKEEGRRRVLDDEAEAPWTKITEESNHKKIITEGKEEGSNYGG